MKMAWKLPGRLHFLNIKDWRICCYRAYSPTDVERGEKEESDEQTGGWNHPGTTLEPSISSVWHASRQQTQLSKAPPPPHAPIL